MRRLVFLSFLCLAANHVLGQSGCVTIAADTIVLCSDGVPVTLPEATPLGGFYNNPGVNPINGSDFFFNTQDVAPGFYNLIYTYSGGTCTGSDTIVAQVISSGIVSVFGADTTICLGDTAILQTTKNELVSWLGSASGNQTFDSIAYYAPSTSGSFFYEYSYLADDNMSCIVRKYFDVNVNYFQQGPFITGPDFTCSGVSESFFMNPSDLINGEEYSWYWSNGELGIGIDTIFQESGPVELIITSLNGCDSTLAFDVEVSITPELSVETNFELCSGDPFYPYPSGGDYYRIGVDLFPSNSDIILYPQSDTSYFITAFSSDLVEECSDTATINVRFFPYPSIVVSGLDTICRGESVSMSVSGADSYEWFELDNSESVVYPSLSNTDSITFFPDSSVLVFVRGYRYICSDFEIIEVLVNQLPDVRILESGASCLDSNVVYTAAGASIYEWANGSDTPQFDEVLSNDTIYYLRGLDTVTTCINYDTLEVVVHPNPSVQIFAPDSVCSIDSFQLNAIGAESYHWSHTSLTDSSWVLASLLFDDYIVVKGLTEFGCGGLDTAVIDVVEKPILFTTPGQGICEGDSVAVQVFSDGPYSPALENDILHFTPVSDTSIIFEASNAFGCVTTVDVHFTVEASPDIVVTGFPDACPGETLQFEVFGAENYFWNIANSGTQASIIVTSDSIITVAGFDANGCLGSNTFEINMRDIPASDILGDDFICSGGSTVLQGAGDFELLWEGVISDSQLVLNNILADTLIQVQVTNEFGCEAFIEKWVRVADVNPDVTILGDDSLCAGESTTLFGGGDAYFLWFDSIPGSNFTFQNLFGDSIFSITAYNDQGCDTTFSKWIYVFDYPEITFDEALFACEGEYVTVNANANAPVLWEDGVFSPYRQFLISSDTSLSALAIGENSCISSDTIFIGISAAPEVSVSTSNGACVGDVITIEATGAEVYQWSNGAAGNSISVEAGLNQTYSVTGFNLNGCYSVTSIIPDVEEAPVIQLQFYADTVCEFNEGIELVISPSGGVLSGDGVIEGVFSPSGPGIYEIQYEVISDNGCVASEHDMIFVDDCVGVAEDNSSFNKIYPNPGNGSFTWDHDIKRIEVVDAFGRLVLVQNSISGLLDLTQLADGTYFLIGYTSDDRMAREKYMKVSGKI